MTCSHTYMALGTHTWCDYCVRKSVDITRHFVLSDVIFQFQTSTSSAGWYYKVLLEARPRWDDSFLQTTHRVCIDHRSYKGQHEQEPLCSASPANWGPLNNTGQKLLSQWVVIDFYLSDSSTFLLLSNEPAAPSFPAVPLIARWRYHSPSWPTECIEVERSCISCQALLAVKLTRRAIPFHRSFHLGVHSLPLLCRQMLCSSPQLYFQSGQFWFTWNWGHVGKTFLNRTFQSIWKVYIHLYVFQLCKVPFHRSCPATPPMLVFVLVAL